MIRFLKRRGYQELAEYLEALCIVIPVALLLRTFGYGLYQVPSSSMEPTMLIGERFFADKFTVHFKELRRGDIVTFNDPNFTYSNKMLAYAFQKYLWGPRNLTKRIIGIPGDTIRGDIQNGKPVIYVNGKLLFEPYINRYPLVPIDADKDVWRVYDPNFAFAEQPFYKLDSKTVASAQAWYEQRGEKPFRLPYDGSPDPSEDVFEVTLAKGQYWVMGDNRIGSYDSRSWGPLEGRHIHGKILYRLWSIDSQAAWWIFDILRHPTEFWKNVRWGRSFKRI